jgi:outer membrane protein
MMKGASLIALVSLCASSVVSAEAPPRELRLDEALRLAERQQPNLRQARAVAEAASARARQALAPMLPQVSMGLGYSRSTANFAPRPGAIPSSISSATTLSATSYDFWSGNLTVSGTLWDFGRNWSRYEASLSTVDAQTAGLHTAERAVRLAVRSAYFQAAAQRDLLRVAEATLANTESHLVQIEGFVRAGARPEIDLAQSRAERASARLAVVNASANYALSKARLNQSMGVAAPTDYDVVDATPAAVDGEVHGVDEALQVALSSRSEIAGADAHLRAQRLLLESARSGYWPILGAQLGVSLGARSLEAPVPNGNAQVTLNWPLFEGGLTTAQVAEHEASLIQLEAQRDLLVAQVRLEVEQSLLAVKSSLEAVGVADEALAAAQERLRLAEGRYRAGAGSIIELGDAQVAFTTAASQRVQSVFGLAGARIQLLSVLGRG